MTNRSKPIYLRGQGIAKIAVWQDDGTLGPFKRPGNVPNVTLDPSVTWIEHRESQTGYQYKDLMIPSTTSLKVAFTLEETSPNSLPHATYSESVDLTAQTFTNVALPTNLEVGSEYIFGEPGSTISSIVDSAAVPATVPASAYTVNTDGTLMVNEPMTGFTMPLLASGNQVSRNKTGILSSQSRDICLIVEGINTANGRKPVTLIIHRLRMNPAKQISLINDKDLAKYELEGEALFVSGSGVDAILSGYGSITLVN